MFAPIFINFSTCYNDHFFYFGANRKKVVIFQVTHNFHSTTTTTTFFYKRIVRKSIVKNVNNFFYLRLSNELFNFENTFKKDSSNTPYQMRIERGNYKITIYIKRQSNIVILLYSGVSL